LFILSSSPAFATHEVDHRFTVYGTVYDDRGRPVADTKVIVVDPRLDEGMTVFTDRNGEFEALLHLHNTDLGDEIIVTALDQRKTIRAEFDPNDKVTVRKGRIDIGAPGTGRPGFWGIGMSVLAGTVLMAGVTVAFVFWRRSRRTRLPASQELRKKE
jgi:hypothetical protein